MSNPLDLSLHALGAETATGQGTDVDAGTLRTCAKLDLVVTAVSGTSPTLAVSVETSADQSVWTSAGSFKVANAVGRQRLTVGHLSQYVRAAWTIAGGTPSFTFSVLGKGHVVYAEPEDLLAFGLPEAALANVPDGERLDKIIAACSVADRHLQRVFTLPLSAWGDGLRLDVAAIAAWNLMTTRGYNPEGTLDVLRQRWEDAMTSLKSMEDKTKPPDIVDATPDTFDAGVVIYSDEKRGW